MNVKSLFRIRKARPYLRGLSKSKHHLEHLKEKHISKFVLRNNNRDNVDNFCIRLFFQTN